MRTIFFKTISCLFDIAAWRAMAEVTLAAQRTSDVLKRIETSENRAPTCLCCRLESVLLHK